ncbi:hypothetical protein Tco_0394772 [Tanacetum coccineum]
MSTLTFADTHNMVTFLDKPAESDGFHEIIDFLNANQIRYALTVNPTIIKSDLHLEDAGGTDCLPTATIFEELAWMGAKSTTWNEFSSTTASLIICLATNQRFNLSKYIFDAMVKHLDGGVKFLMYPQFLQVFINQQLGDMSHHKQIYVNPSHTKKIFANMKREEKDFSGRITPLFETMMVQPTQDKGVDLGIPIDSLQTPIPTQPSSSRSQKKQSKRKQRKDTVVTQEDPQQDDIVPTPSSDPPLSEKAKDAQAKEIANLKKRVQRLEKKKKSRTIGLKRLKKVGMSRRVESSEDQESLGDHEDASKQGRIIKDIDKDDDVSLANDTQMRSDDANMFDIDDLHGDEVNVDMPVGNNQEQSVKERKVDTSVEDSAAPTTIEEITLAQTLIQIKAAKPKVVNTAATTTTTTTRPKARGVVVQELNQVALDEDLARNLQAQLEAEIVEEEKLARKQEEEANIALIEKKHFAMLRAEEKRRKTPTKAQKRNLMSTYLKNMDKSKRETEESSKGTKDELESDKSKKSESNEEKVKGIRKKMLETNEHEEVEENDEAELKKHLDIDREDLQTLWKLVKTKHGDIRPEDEHKRVLWGDLKVMFEPDIKSDVWRNLQGYKVTIWKLYDSCGIQRLNIKFRGGLLGLKRLQGFLELLLLRNMVQTRQPNNPPDVAEIIAQQLQNIIPNIMTQVTNNLKNDNGNGNGGGNNGCTYKGFVACGPRDFDGTSGAAALTI